MTAPDLADAVTLFTAAGRAALHTQAASADWYQVHIEFASWDAAEHAAASHIWPRLRVAETDGTLAAWWYIRKAPCWRLRCHAGTAAPTTLTQVVADTLDDLTRRNIISRWWPSLYEPEACAFGGPPGAATAHRLFHADSRSILDHLHRTATHPRTDSTLGRRELSMLLCTSLLRGAGQDWHEQGDVWHRVAQMRPLPPGAPTQRLHTTTRQVRELLALDTTPPPPADDTGPLASARDWLAAFTHAGHTLGTAAHQGTLHRGIRDVLAHHVIFHWNRLGIPDTAQAVLAHAAVAATLDPTPRPGHGTDVATS